MVEVAPHEPTLSDQWFESATHDATQCRCHLFVPSKVIDYLVQLIDNPLFYAGAFMHLACL